MSLTSLVLAASTKGLLSVPAVVAVVLVSVVLRVAGRSRGKTIGQAVRAFFLIALPLASLALFVLSSGGGDPRQITAIAGSVFSLLLVIFGLYVMLRGMFTRR